MKFWTWTKRLFFPTLSLALGVSLLVQYERASVLRERVELLERLDTLQGRWCEGVERVNRICEAQFVEVLQQLGLDNRLMPLMTTALWKRATGNFRVSAARKLWGAKSRPGDHFLVPEDVLPGKNPLDNPPIGGPTDED